MDSLIIIVDGAVNLRKIVKNRLHNSPKYFLTRMLT